MMQEIPIPFHAIRNTNVRYLVACASTHAVVLGASSLGELQDGVSIMIGVAEMEGSDEEWKIDGINKPVPLELHPSLRSA